MTFQRTQKIPNQTQETTQSQLTSRPFVPIQRTTPSPEQQGQQTEGLVQRKTNTNLLEIPGLMAEPKRPKSPKKLIQAKLTIGQPGDKYEQEADAMAHQVVQRIHQPQGQKLQRESVLEEDELQMKPQGSIQRESLVEDEELQMKPMVQRRSVEGIAASPDLEASIQQARAGGQPLADNIRQPMEQAFEADFRGVKVHTDAQSHQLNQSIQAKAFTTGQDVFFGKGYSPDNKFLLAHELTHVVQQNGNAVQRSQETHVKTGQSSYGVIQRDEEVDAAARTANMQIRRGNRRGSLDETEYESLAKKEFFKDYQEKIKTELLERLQRDHQTFFYLLFGDEIQDIIEDYTPFVAILAELFQAGNCDEFAASTYTYLTRNTAGKAIYLANMVGAHNGKTFKHTFTITSPQAVENPTDLNPETAVVIDAWFNYKVLKLAQFYNGVNPYEANIDASNINFKRMEVSTGRKLPIANGVITYIRDAALHIYAKYMDNYNESLQDMRDEFDEIDQEDVFEFDRTDRNVHDMRTQM